MSTMYRFAEVKSHRNPAARLTTSESPDYSDAQDAALRQSIVRFLAAIGVQEMENVDVTVVHGEATLHGRVVSAHDRWLCRNGAGRVAGVLRVTDQLEIRDGLGQIAWGRATACERVNQDIARQFQQRKPK